VVQRPIASKAETSGGLTGHVLQSQITAERVWFQAFWVLQAGLSECVLGATGENCGVGPARRPLACFYAVHNRVIGKQRHHNAGREQSPSGSLCLSTTLPPSPAVFSCMRPSIIRPLSDARTPFLHLQTIFPFLRFLSVTEPLFHRRITSAPWPTIGAGTAISRTITPLPPPLIPKAQTPSIQTRDSTRAQLQTSLRLISLTFHARAPGPRLPPVSKARLLNSRRPSSQSSMP
jgi:hypothetical protein